MREEVDKGFQEDAEVHVNGTECEELVKLVGYEGTVQMCVS
jgi:hypothetical protein